MPAEPIAVSAPDLSNAGALVDKVVKHMDSQNIGPQEIAFALLAGAMAVLSRGMSDEAIIGILNGAIASVRAGELRYRAPVARN